MSWPLILKEIFIPPREMGLTEMSHWIRRLAIMAMIIIVGMVVHTMVSYGYIDTEYARASDRDLMALRSEIAGLSNELGRLSDQMTVREERDLRRHIVSLVRDRCSALRDENMLASVYINRMIRESQRTHLEMTKERADEPSCQQLGYEVEG